jgi:hypothetical protein
MYVMIGINFLFSTVVASEVLYLNWISVRDTLSSCIVDQSCDSTLMIGRQIQVYKVSNLFGRIRVCNIRNLFDRIRVNIAFSSNRTSLVYHPTNLYQYYKAEEFVCLFA